MKKAILVITVINILRIPLIPLMSHLPFDWIQSLMLVSKSYGPDTIMQFFHKTISHFNVNPLKTLQWFNFTLSLFTQYAVLVLIQKIIRPIRKFQTWIAISSTLLITILTILPVVDNLVCLFWMLALTSLYSSIFENNRKAWMLGGIFLGFAMLLKLSALALPIGMLLFLIFSSQFRHQLFKPGVYITLTVAIIISLPFWLGYSNTESSDLSITLAHNVFQFLGFSLNSFAAFIIFQLLMIFPVLFVGLWWLTFKYIGRIFEKPNQVNAEFWFLLAFFLPLFLGFHIVSMFDWVDFFGLAPIYIIGCIVFFKLAKIRWLRLNLIFALVIHLLFFGIIVFQ